jgi:hypothetical protein
VRDALSRADDTLGRLIDGLTDWALASFAIWVLLAFVAEVAHAPVQPFLVFWLVLLLPLAGLLWWLRRRPSEAQDGLEPREGPGAGDARTGAGSAPRDRRSALIGWGVPLIAGLAGAGLAAHAHATRWALAWALGSAALAFGLVYELSPRWLRLQPPVDGVAAPRPMPGINLIVSAVAVGSGILSLFVFRPDDDDVYYLNRAASVADFDRIPVRDMILTHGHLPAVAGTGAPVDALAPLQGALARLLGVHAATVAYLATPLVATILAVFALWRLVRSWAPRRAAGAFVLAVAFLYFDGNTHWSFGNFFLTRIWQGKVVFVAWLVPLVLVYLTDWARRPSRWTGALLVLAGLAAIGLTVSATYDFPLLMAAGLLPVIGARHWRALILPVAASIAPFVIGVVASRRSPPAGIQISNLSGAGGTFHEVLGVGALAALCALMLWFGQRLPRDRSARLLALGTSVIVTLSLAPGLLHALGHAIGVGGALRRIVWIVPVPTLVGLVATVPLPELVVRRATVVRAGIAVALTAVLTGGVALAGTAILNPPNATVMSHPTWKTSALQRAEAQQILAKVEPGAEVLAPPGVMRAISIITARIHAVMPRSYYATLIKQPAAQLRARYTLNHFELKTPSGIPNDRVLAALRLLHVSDVCLFPIFQGQQKLIENNGYEFAFSTSDLNCYRAINSSL